MKYGWVVVAGFILAGCGGSSDNGVEPPVTGPPPPPPNTELVLYGETTVQTGDSADFAITTNNSTTISEIQWQNPTGDIEPLAAHTQAIGFDAPAVGDYPFTVTATLTNGEQKTYDFVLNVIDTQQPLVIARLGHEASEGNRVSLRVDTDPTREVSDINWRQLSGPAAVNIRYNAGDGPSKDIYFQAPAVTADAVMVFEASVEFADGTTASDEVQVLVKNIDIDADSYFVDEVGNTLQTVTGHMQPYRPQSPYAEALAECVYGNRVADTCQFGTLPLIGQETENPTNDDILNRTYVSHPWMGDAFSAFLESSAASDDIRNLLRATTAVVISYEVRPSFYWVATGAIYLDARNFWRTPAERDTLNTIPDYRSGFGNDLDYVTSWRYVQDGSYYYPQPGLARSLRNSRSLAGVEAALTWLLYHELAHANDFFNYQTWSQLADNDDPLSYYNRNNTLSDGLVTALPLTSQELHELADVAYGGATASAEQRNYSAEQVANWFEPDGAVSFYAYFTRREDFATLLERFMMLYRLGVSSDVGVFTRETFAEQEYLLTWGQRNRVNAQQLQPRVDYVISRVLPEINVPAAQAQLPSPVALPAGASWQSTVSLESESTDKPGVTTTSDQNIPALFAEEHAQMPALPKATR
ncbi:hypothetical protein OCL06_05535 [Alteromonas sp. ASW11-19]|uniref:Lipoprotein n=1 Tax=Alteromonas salexigens TaxID=2982530 RepID=A0ABT2VMI4_9ALTE|nr:hypothetical protein [Alteromonas salexigens]MCU7554057.1 hypothetical protein [Alteromonas salexigens]